MKVPALVSPERAMGQSGWVSPEQIISSHTDVLYQTSPRVSIQSQWVSSVISGSVPASGGQRPVKGEQSARRPPR